MSLEHKHMLFWVLLETTYTVIVLLEESLDKLLKMMDGTVRPHLLFGCCVFHASMPLDKQ